MARTAVLDSTELGGENSRSEVMGEENHGAGVGRVQHMLEPRLCEGC